jgi:hydrogenase-4 component B
MKNYMSKASAIALIASACVIPMLGLLPDIFMTGVGQLAQPFMNAADPHHMPVPYFSHENLVGAAKSIVIGIVLFFLQRAFVMKKGTYPERWPKWLDLENSVYRPFIGLLIKVGYGFAWLVDRLMDWAIVAMKAIGGFFARLFDSTGDGLSMTVRRLFLPQITKKQPIPVGNRLTYAVGRALDSLAAFHARLTGRKVANETHYESLLAAGQHEATTQFKRFTRSVSFGLFMFCVGLIVTLVFLLIA